MIFIRQCLLDGDSRHVELISVTEAFKLGRSCSASAVGCQQKQKQLAVSHVILHCMAHSCLFCQVAE